MQDGKTALWLACENQHEAAAMELVEPTKDVLEVLGSLAGSLLELSPRVYVICRSELG